VEKMTTRNVSALAAACLATGLAVSVDAAPAYYNLGASANVSGLSADGSVASGYLTAGPFF
jgi:hypothetical protein